LTALFSNGKLKISCIGGEQHKIRDINHTQLEADLILKTLNGDSKSHNLISQMLKNYVGINKLR
jgi:hypothetical protein